MAQGTTTLAGHASTFTPRWSARCGETLEVKACRPGQAGQADGPAPESEARYSSEVPAVRVERRRWIDSVGLTTLIVFGLIGVIT
jgi:hypothetical protein